MSVDRVIKNKLLALGYPTVDAISFEDVNFCGNVVVWLEDRVIRSLPISERFRDINSKQWPAFLNEYLRKLRCPFDSTNPYCYVDWLVNRGLELQSSDEDADIKPLNLNNEEDQTTITNNIFSNIDTESDEFKKGTEKLAKLLKIPIHVDPKECFKAVCLLIEQKLSDQSISEANEKYGIEKVDILKEKDICLGFDIKDSEIKSAAMTLRLLHLTGLRELQNQINSAIVQVQQLTADPKTDEKLGQVGF